MTDLRKLLETLEDYVEQALTQHDQQYQRHPSTERDRQVIVNDLEALRTALAQPEQEPVAWVCRGVYSPTGHCPECQPLYTAPPSIEAAILAEREACAEWLRDNYQDYKNIADICEAIRVRGEK